MIVRDCNQCTENLEALKFYDSVGVENTHQEINQVLSKALDKIHMSRSKAIDVVIASIGVMLKDASCYLMRKQSIWTTSCKFLT